MPVRCSCTSGAKTQQRTGELWSCAGVCALPCVRNVSEASPRSRRKNNASCALYRDTMTSCDRLVAENVEPNGHGEQLSQGHQLHRPPDIHPKHTLITLANGLLYHFASTLCVRLLTFACIQIFVHFCMRASTSVLVRSCAGVLSRVRLCVKTRSLEGRRSGGSFDAAYVGICKHMPSSVQIMSTILKKPRLSAAAAESRKSSQNVQEVS